MPKIIGGVSTDGYMDAGLGFRHGGAAGPSWTTGTGTPEGAVTAPVGSLFSRLDGVAGTVLYCKETGTGNTGWAVSGGELVWPVQRIGGDAQVILMEGDVLGTEPNAAFIMVVPGGMNIGRNGIPLNMTNEGTSSTLTIYGQVAAGVTVARWLGGTNGTPALNYAMGDGFKQGDWAVDYGGSIWINTATGATPTWVEIGAGGGGGAVDSVDGRTGVVTLSDLYVDIAGDNMTGNLGLGYPSPTAKLQFAASTVAAGGISFGTDTTLYRAAPGWVYATDNFVSGMIQASVIRLQDLDGPTWQAGVTDPEGAVVAPRGSLYSDLDNLPALYIKTEGDRNSAVGWMPVATGTGGGVTSVDGKTGVVSLAADYVNVTGDNMTGNLGLGSPSPTAKLQFAANTVPAGGILFGTDVTLYRDAADSLMTDDQFRATGVRSTSLQPAATLGADLLVNGAFTTNLTGWTNNGNWAWNAGTAKHTAGAGATYTLSQTVNGLTVSAYYVVSVVMTGRTAGTATINVGGIRTHAMTSSDTIAIAAPSTSVSVDIEPSADFDGAIDQISLRLATGTAIAQINLDAPAGASQAELRASGSNVGFGSNSLLQLGSATNLTAVGTNALRRNVAGTNSTAVGAGVLANSNGSGNTAIGANSAGVLTVGANNTAVGVSALAAATTGAGNVAIGASALGALTTSTGAVAIGESALALATAGTNVAVGYRAGYAPGGNTAYASTTGNFLTFLGYQAGQSNASATQSATAIGANTLVTGQNATALGAGASAGIGSLALGAGAIAGSNCIAIGRDSQGTVATASANDEIVLGTFRHKTRIEGEVIQQASPGTTPMGNIPALKIATTDPTVNNWSEIYFKGNGTPMSGGLLSKNLNHTLGYGEFWFYQRSPAGLYPRVRIPNTGGLEIYGDANTVVATVSNAGLIDAAAGFRHGSVSAPSWTKGTGTPEGAVTAPIGSIFSRTDGSTGTALYRKEAGTGNTGWAAVATGGGGVTSVDGRSGVVTLSDLYVDVTGDTMTGSLLVRTPTTVDSTAELMVSASAAGRKPLVVQAFAGQTANLFEVQASTGVGAGLAAGIGPDGHLAIGAQNSATAMIRAGQAGVNGMFNTASTSWGVWVEATNMGTGPLIGVYARPDNTSGATTASITGGQFGAKVSSATGVATIARMVELLSPSITAGGLVTTAVGLDVQAQKVTGVTNGYGIYQRGASDINYFAGNVGMGADAIADYQLYIAPIITRTSPAFYGAVIQPYNNGTGSVTGLSVNPGSPAVGVAALLGVDAGVRVSSATGTVTAGTALRALGPTITAGGTIGTAVALDLGAQKVTGVTAGYGILQRGASDINSFAGPVAVGANPASAGIVRLQNSQWIAARNDANTADVNMWCVASNTILAGAYVNMNGQGISNFVSLAPAEGGNVVIGTTTGTKFGTATTQKLGWWNATPVVQNTGWSATAGYTANKVFNPESTTLTEVARVLGTLLDALKSYGVLG